MRIAGEIQHSKYKITILHMNNRFSVQFEDGEQTQIYKIPDLEHLNDVNGIKQLIDPNYVKSVDVVFEQMKKSKYLHIRDFIQQSGEEEFETII